MFVRLLFILGAFSPLLASAQSLVIEIEYEPNTIYTWSRTYSYSNSVQFLGAEDKGDLLMEIGWDPYSENKNNQFIQVSMNTSERLGESIPYSVAIDSFEQKITTTGPDDRTPPVPLEIDDLEIQGVINKFQKLEIDSIIGVDSLHEKNRVFALLDDIHRSWSYSKDTMAIGVPLVKSKPYNRNPSVSTMNKTYTLESIDDDMAKIRVDYIISTEKEGETGELLDTRIFEGTGHGWLHYDINHKQVILYEYTIDEKSWNEVMEMSVETSSTTNFRWIMNIEKKD